MKTIQITAGTFGWKHGNRYDLVLAGDPPIEVDDALAQRLVEKGVAKYATPIREDNPQAGEGPALEGMTAKELRELGKQYGLTFSVHAKKTEMIEAIQAAQPQESDDAPTFDAAEAVQ